MASTVRQRHDGPADRTPDATPARTPALTPAQRRARRQAWVPPQHGAWGMLAVPFVLGVASSGPTLLHLPLLVAWYGAYLASYDGFRILRVRRRQAYQAYLAPFLTYSAVTVAAAAVVVVAVPSVALFALAYVPLLVANVLLVRRGQERSLANDLLLVAEACVMAPVAYVVGVGGTAGADAAAAATAALVSVLFLVGTVLHVKVMIRERRSSAYRLASRVWHAAALVVATVVSPWLLIPFAFLLGRAAVMPGRRIAVRTVGLVELAGTVLVLVFGWVAL